MKDFWTIIICVILLIVSLAFIITKHDRKVNIDSNLPKEISVVRSDGDSLYLKVGNKYYIRTYHGNSKGYTVYEVDRTVVYGGEK